MKEKNKLDLLTALSRSKIIYSPLLSWSSGQWFRGILNKPILTSCYELGSIIKNYVTKSTKLVSPTKLTIKNLLKNSPQKKGIILKILILKPKKPNSANRKIAKVKISNRSLNSNGNTIIRAYIPGEGHTLHIHNNVLIKGGKTKDLPGINYKIIRGALDCAGVLRSKKRSKYGCKKPNN